MAKKIKIKNILKKQVTINKSNEMQENNVFLPQAAGSDPVGNCKKQNNDSNNLVKTIQKCLLGNNYSIW